MSGFYLMHRGWMDNDLFQNEPYSERMAWCWLIENAAWKETKARVKGETVPLQRGQMCFAIRFLAEKWGWSKSRVDRFLRRLAAENMISMCSKIGTTAGQQTGQGSNIITLCNYSQYQDKREGARDSSNDDSGTTAGQQRDKEEQVNNLTKNNTNYVFAGQTIKLNQCDFDEWASRYSGLADIRAQLGSLDDWISDQPEAQRKKWFTIVSGALNKRHQAAMAGERDEIIMPVA
jgi:hypothetical protein